MKQSLILVLFVVVSSLFFALSCGSSTENFIEATQDEHSFVSIWKTKENDSIALPLVENGRYDFTVNWGDGSENTITQWDNKKKAHIYNKPGSYTVTINGTIVGWEFGNRKNESADNIIEISQWGSLGFGDTKYQFAWCSFLTISADDAPSLAETHSLAGAFSNCSHLTTISAKEWDVSNITNMDSMFNRATLFNGDISGWDVSNVTGMQWMFNGAEKFNQDISGWDVSQVVNMEVMFAGALVFNRDISNWDVSHVTNMNQMFAGGFIEPEMGGGYTQGDTTTLFDQDLSSWDISNSWSMDGMFSGNTLSTENYDALLIGWSEKAVKRSVSCPFDGGNSKYSAGEAADARQKLIDDYNWIITDGGMVE